MKNDKGNNSNLLKFFTRFFLNEDAKYLFLLFILPPIILLIIYLQLKVALMVKLFFALLLTPIFYLWNYILGTNLYSKLPLNNNMRIKSFKFYLTYSFIYYIADILNWALGQPINKLALYRFSLGLEGLDMIYIIFLSLVLFVFYIFNLFAFFYEFYFISKALVSVEKQRMSSLSEYFKEFLMIVFLPIGIWFLQPRIQKIFKTGI